MDTAPQPGILVGSGQIKQPHHGSTATSPQQNGSGQPDKQPREGQSWDSRRGGDPSSTGTAGSGTTGELSDMERGDPSSSNGTQQNSTASRPQANTQRRLVSYVSHGAKNDDKKEASTEDNSRNVRIGEAAVDIVIEHEKKKGRKARSMAHPNPGYDIISEGEDKIRYIEVKGTEAAWGERGVAMTPTQFFYTQEKPERDHWLYVVENVFSTTPQIH